MERVASQFLQTLPRRALGRSRRALSDLRARALYQRRLRLYVVGLPKTGTTSLAEMFSSPYRVGHEHGQWILPAVVRYLRGEASEREIRQLLARRAAQVRLDVDSASFLGHFTSTLAELHADAQFVITVRDCRSWLRSITTHLATRPVPARSSWRDYQDARFGLENAAFESEEGPLAAAGLYPVAAFLSYWSHAYEQLLDATPGSRRILLETRELDASARALSEFTRAPEERIRPARANTAPLRWPAFDEIPEEFIDRQIERHCARTMARLFGDAWRTAPILTA